MKKLLLIVTVSAVCAVSTGSAQAKPGGAVVCIAPASYIHCNAFGNCYCSLYP
jgi:hypothetical protein